MTGREDERAGRWDRGEEGLGRRRAHHVTTWAPSPWGCMRCDLQGVGEDRAGAAVPIPPATGPVCCELRRRSLWPLVKANPGPATVSDGKGRSDRSVQ